MCEPINPGVPPVNAETEHWPNGCVAETIVKHSSARLALQKYTPPNAFSEQFARCPVALRCGLLALLVVPTCAADASAAVPESSDWSVWPALVEFVVEAVCESRDSSMKVGEDDEAAWPLREISQILLTWVGDPPCKKCG